jgi:adenylate kinase
LKAIILLGAPGAGKGTLAEGIKARTKFIHISTGDMLRDAVKKGSAIGREAETFMKRGELVPDDVILRLVEERLDQGSPDDEYLFDGFPRTLEQAEMLSASLRRRGSRVMAVFSLEAPRELLISRLCGRRLCRQCGASYHVVNIPPRKAGICDVCGGELYQRADDQESTILNRLEVFTRQTESLIAYYEGMKVLIRVDAAQHRDLAVEAILGHIRKLPSV